MSSSRIPGGLFLPIVLVLFAFESDVPAQSCAQPTTSTAINVCSPTEGGSFSSPVAVVARGGTAVTWMELWLDGFKRYSQAGNTVNVSYALGAGSHHVTVFGKNSSGVTDSRRVNFIVSSGGCAAPASSGALNVCSPTEGSSVSSPVNVSIRGGAAVDTIEVWIDGVKRHQVNGNTVSTQIALATGARRMSLYAKSVGTITDKRTVLFTVTSSNAVETVVETFASGLQIPWEMVFPPDGRKFVTERPGRIRVITAAGQLLSTPMYQGSSPNTEAGLLGMALDPDFANNHRLYVFHCFDLNVCRVLRLVENNNQATVEKVLLELGSGQKHVAGRIGIGPDGFLYIAFGDRGLPARAQDLNFLEGKILRITTDGAPAPGNPFPAHPLIYAYGFRDPQGIAWDASGQLYGTDHGEVANDEVNIIFRGRNYGWPVCEGTCTNPAYEAPVRVFTGTSVPPSGGDFYLSGLIPQWRDSLFFGTLGVSSTSPARHVHRIKFAAPASRTIVEEEVLYKDTYGRIRNVVEGRDGYLYFMTSNGGGADRILRVRPK